jgi:hypothetical protein
MMQRTSDHQVHTVGGLLDAHEHMAGWLSKNCALGAAAALFRRDEPSIHNQM